MEKKRYEIEVAGVQLAILSDEREDFIKNTVEALDKQIREITVASKRSSNLDAAILCALEYYSEKVKAEKRARNLEAQISLYDANLRRFRDENSNLREKLAALENGEKTEVPADEKAASEEVADESEEEKSEEKKEERPADADGARAARLRAIEELLKARGNKGE